MKISKLGKVAVVAAVSTALALPTFTTATAASKFASATSASQVGGLAGLANECRKEGQLNVIALPHDWADYGSIIEKFKSKYGVKVDEANPDAGSQEEIDTANRLKGTSRSPDVFDIGYPTAGTYPGTGICWSIDNTNAPMYTCSIGRGDQNVGASMRLRRPYSIDTAGYIHVGKKINNNL